MLKSESEIRQNSYQSTKFTEGCYSNHFASANPFHEGFLIIVKWAWVYANVIFPLFYQQSTSSAGSGAQITNQVSRECKNALAFFVSEDDETLSAVMRGQQTVFADGTLPHQNEFDTKHRVAKFLASYYER